MEPLDIKQGSFSRAWADTERFRHSAKSFWGTEVVGAAGFAAIGIILTPPDASGIEQAVYPGIGVVFGFAIVFGLVFLWNLFRAPYKQRDEARATLNVIADSPEKRARKAIQALTPLVTSGNTLLGMYGQGDKPCLPWDWMIHYGFPAMNAWYQEVGQALSEFAPDFIATWNNDGQIYLNTEQKAASIQQLEGRLKRLGEILRDIRTPL